VKAAALMWRSLKKAEKWDRRGNIEIVKVMFQKKSRALGTQGDGRRCIDLWGSRLSGDLIIRVCPRPGNRSIPYLFFSPPRLPKGSGPRHRAVRVLNIWSAHDVRKAVNPSEGQIEGESMGLRFALTEKMFENEDTELFLD
jgi:hypothetical protein